MGPTWVLSAPDGPHVGPMNLAIRESNLNNRISNNLQMPHLASNLLFQTNNDFDKSDMVISHSKIAK